jgi:hypothetical protein
MIFDTTQGGQKTWIQVGTSFNLAFGTSFEHIANLLFALTMVLLYSNLIRLHLGLIKVRQIAGEMIEISFIFGSVILSLNMLIVLYIQ